MSTTEEKGPGWYTIKEAAKYLSIGEPTLYRWMRDGKITYRKVGDSTRFLREDLDSFIQIVPSAKDVAKVSEICPVCHHNKLVDGVFRTTGLNYFMPKRTKFWSLKPSNIKTAAKMCPRCGAIAHFGDLQKLRKLIDAPVTSEEEE